MIYFAIFAFASLLLVAATAVFVCGHVIGELKVKNKWIVDLKRGERRSHFQLELWQSKAIERSGLGPLRRRDTPLPDARPSRQIVSQSQAIARQKEQDSGAPRVSTQQVPPSIKHGFLNEAGGNGRK